ncbi:MAG: MFS transporter, partial [Pseudomonadota bacterium]|nr:MFS transporter [Pseudomonadota bacterium]
MPPPRYAPGSFSLCACLILTLSVGIRQTFGLFLQPMSVDLGWGRETFAFALAAQNLVWGLAQPFAGMIADKFGAGRVVITGSLLYALGLLLMAYADTALGLDLSAGVLIGLGLSGTTFGVVMGVVGRAVSAEKRSMALGIAGAGGSLGTIHHAALWTNADQLLGLAGCADWVCAIDAADRPAGVWNEEQKRRLEKRQRTRNQRRIEKHRRPRRAQHSARGNAQHGRGSAPGCRPSGLLALDVQLFRVRFPDRFHTLAFAGIHARPRPDADYRR